MMFVRGSLSGEKEHSKKNQAGTKLWRDFWNFIRLGYPRSFCKRANLLMSCITQSRSLGVPSISRIQFWIRNKQLSVDISVFAHTEEQNMHKQQIAALTANKTGAKVEAQILACMCALQPKGNATFKLPSEFYRNLPNKIDPTRSEKFFSSR